MDPMTAISIIEGNYEVDEEIFVEAWQYLIDTGLAFKLQGCYGRAAMNLIERGVCSYAS